MPGAKKKIGVDLGVDFRDIDEQIQEEVDYWNSNIDRGPEIDAQALYANESEGSQVAGWSGNCDQGKSLEYGLFSLQTQASIHEHKMDFGRMKVGVTGEDDQIGIEGDVKAVSHEQRIGPVRVQASALGAGGEAGVGRNTGAFVRANLVSVGGSAGPVSGFVGLGFDTGGRVGADGIEGKFLGCGGMIDRNRGIGISVFGTSFTFKPW